MRFFPSEFRLLIVAFVLSGYTHFINVTGLCSDLVVLVFVLEKGLGLLLLLLVELLHRLLHAHLQRVRCIALMPGTVSVGATLFLTLLRVSHLKD